MPFDNFYEESDKAARRWWKCVGLAFLLFTGYWVVALSLMSDTDRNGRHPQGPTVSERMNRIDELCSQLPKPEEFYFVGKTVPTETSRFVSIDYTFRSSRSKAEIFPVYILWFGANGWTADKTRFECDDKTPSECLDFRKNNQTIGITPYFTTDGDYFSIYCTDWKVE